MASKVVLDKSCQSSGRYHNKDGNIQLRKDLYQSSKTLTNNKQLQKIINNNINYQNLLQQLE